MKIYKFGGASVKDANGIKNVTGIIQKESDKLAVVISAMGKTTNLLETLIKAYFEKSQHKWDVLKDFRNYHQQVIDELFGEGKTPVLVADFFLELEQKLKKAPSLDFNFEYDQIICYGEEANPIINIGEIKINIYIVK